MKKKLIAALIPALLLAGCGKDRPVPEGRLVQPAGEFSYVTPDGWFRTKLAGVDFVIVSTDADSGISPNIFIGGVFPDIQVLDLVGQVEKNNQRTLREYMIGTYENFETESGLKGIKIEATHRSKETLLLATFQYLIQDADRVISITCSCSDTVKTKYEPVFDAAMASLESERTSQQGK